MDSSIDGPNDLAHKLLEGMLGGLVSWRHEFNDGHKSIRTRMPNRDASLAKSGRSSSRGTN
jgi:hypothetical protein